VPSSFETIRTVGAPAPNRASHVFPQAEHAEIVGMRSTRSVVPWWSQRSIRRSRVSHSTRTVTVLLSGAGRQRRRHEQAER
jgi:hypothetical protein